MMPMTGRIGNHWFKTHYTPINSQGPIFTLKKSEGTMPVELSCRKYLVIVWTSVHEIGNRFSRSRYLLTYKQHIGIVSLR